MNTDIRSFFLACYMLTSHTVNRSTALAAVLQFSFVVICLSCVVILHGNIKKMSQQGCRLQLHASLLIADIQQACFK